MGDYEGCVEELRRERAQGSFNREELTNLLDGGEKRTFQRRKIGKWLRWDLAFTAVLTICL